MASTARSRDRLSCSATGGQSHRPRPVDRHDEIQRIDRRQSRAFARVAQPATSAAQTSRRDHPGTRWQLPADIVGSRPGTCRVRARDVGRRVGRSGNPSRRNSTRTCSCGGCTAASTRRGCPELASRSPSTSWIIPSGTGSLPTQTHHCVSLTLGSTSTSPSVPTDRRCTASTSVTSRSRKRTARVGSN